MAKKDSPDLNRLDFKWLKTFELENIVTSAKKELEERPGFDLSSILSSNLDLCNKLKQLLIHSPILQGGYMSKKCVKCESLCSDFASMFRICLKSFAKMEFIVKNEFRALQQFKTCMTQFLELEGIEKGNKHNELNKKRLEVSTTVEELEKKCQNIRESHDRAVQIKDGFSSLILSSEEHTWLRNSRSYMQCLSMIQSDSQALIEECRKFSSLKSTHDFFIVSEPLLSTFQSIRTIVSQSAFLYTNQLLFKLKNPELLLGELLEIFDGHLLLNSNAADVLQPVKAKLQECEGTIDRDIASKLNELLKSISKRKNLSKTEHQKSLQSLHCIIICHYQTGNISTQLPSFAQKYNEVQLEISTLYDKAFSWWTARQPHSVYNITDIVAKAVQAIMNFSLRFKFDYMKRCSELVATAMESAEKISCEQDKVGIQKQGQECVRGLPLLSKHLQVLITSENDFSKDHCMKIEKFALLVKEVFTHLWQFHYQLESQESDSLKCDIDILKSNMISWLKDAFEFEEATIDKTEDYVVIDEKNLVLKCEELKELIQRIKKNIAEAMSSRVSTSGEVIFHKKEDSYPHSENLILNEQNVTLDQRKFYIIVSLNAVLQINLWSKTGYIPVVEVFITLRDGKFEIYPFITKYVVNGLAVMGIRFAVSKKLCGQKIHYKYSVHSECEITQELEEMIVTPDGESQQCYRILKLSYEDELHMYDSCIYPAVYSDISILGFDWFLSKITKPKFKIPNRRDEVQNCVTAYMKDNFENLANEEVSNWESAFEIYESSHRIYTCLSNLQKAHIRNDTEHHFLSFTTDCRQMFLLKFDEICQNLNKKSHFTSDQRIFILLALSRCYVESLKADLTAQQTTLILSICPEGSCNIRETYERLSQQDDLRMVPYFKSLLAVVKSFFSTVGLSDVSWIYAFQILNQFNFGDQVPNYKPEHDSVDYFNVFDSLSTIFQSIKQSSLSKILQSEEVLEVVKVDRAVGLLLCHACYNNECHLLVDLVPASALIIHIEHKLRITTIDAKLIFLNDVIKPFNYLLQKLLKKKHTFCSVSAEGTKLLIIGLLQSWQSFRRIHSHDLFSSFGKHTIQLASRMTPYLTECKWDEPCKALVKKWIEVPCSASFQIHSTMIKLENKKWQEFEKMSDDEKWQTFLKNSLRERIKQNKSYGFGDYLKALQNLSGEDGITVHVLTDITIEEVGMADVKELKMISRGDSMLSRMLLCKYLESTQQSTTLNMKSVLTWELWPDVLKVYQIEENRNALTDRSKDLCQSAMTIVREKIEQPVTTGEISFKDYEQFEVQESRITLIVQAIHGDKHPFIDTFQMAKKRIRIFKVYSRLLCYLQEKLGIHVRREEEYANNQLNELCKTCDGIWKFPIINEPAPSICMLVQFAIMTSSFHQTDLFYTKWEVFKHEMLSSEPHNYSAWDNWFSTLYCLVESLENYQIKFSQLFELFGGQERGDIKINIERLAEALNKCSLESIGDIEWISERIDLSQSNLIDSIDSIFHCKSGDIKWIDELTKKIAEWHSVRKLSQYADEMLGILDNLGITSSVCEPLKLLSHKGLKLLEDKMLKEFSSDAEVLQCLKDFDGTDLKRLKAIRKMTELKDLREWIQSKSEDYNEMQTFIEVALDTNANEGDEITDRLHALSDFCGTYSHIIFSLKMSRDSLQSLLKLIKYSWNRITSYDSASANIEFCSNNFQWYKEIGELQGSVERGTKKQLEDINKYGVYHIGIQGSEADFEVILELDIDDQEQQNLSQKIWSYEELLELESKLVLITRPNSPWIKDKSDFQSMLQGVNRMKDILQKLKEHGYLGQLKDKYSLRCSDFKDNTGKSKLKKTCEYYETKLVEWIAYVWSCRLEYYELNFYSTKQLITLRQEITRIRDSENLKDEINPHTYHLLQSVIGKPIESSMLIRRSLPSAEDENDDMTENRDEQKDSENTPIVSLVSESEELSKLDQEIANLNDNQKKIFDELKEKDPYGPDCLFLEAVLQPNINDFSSAMYWCDEQAFDEEFVESLQEKWHKNEDTLSIASDSLSISNLTDISLHQKENSLATSETSSAKIDLVVIVNAFIPYKNSSLSTRAFERELSEETSINLLTMKELGQFLKNIVKRREDEMLTIKRQFSNDYLQEGTPNLLVISPFSIFTSILEIYRQDVEQPLPGFEEVLLCSESTTLEEVVVFWMRALYDEERGRIFSVVHAEKLPYLVAEKSLDLLKYLSQGVKDYRLVIMCSSERDEKSPIITRLHANRRSPTFSLGKSDLKNYLSYHVTRQNVHEMGKSKEVKDPAVEASCVDDTKSQIRVIISNESGVGKSLYIRRMRDKLVRVLKERGKISEKKSALSVVTVPLHGPIVTADEVLHMLLQQISHNNNNEGKEDYRSTIVHLDIPSKVLRSVDDILFSLLILKGLSNNNGQIWRCLPTQLYAVEVTLPADRSYLRKFPEVQRILGLLELLPSSVCVGPTEMKSTNTNEVQIDPIEVRTPMYQRVYQYLRLLESKDSTVKLENFNYLGIIEKNYTDERCIETILKHIGLKAPSWKELRHFVWFLNIQLNTCEESILMKLFKGLKAFIVVFMKIMSRDFATSSMTEGDDSADILKQHEIAQNWGERVHPYLFFNKDHCSVTHMGLALKISPQKTTVVDSGNGNELEINVSPEVLKFLKDKSKVPILSSNYEVGAFVQKLSDFWGFYDNEHIIEKEKFTHYLTLPLQELSYVLTTDNVLKLLGIQTRFRCRIPVVLMGETGCGKTHLIRFMCKFAAYGGILMHEIKEIKRRKLSELDEVNIERKIKQIQNMIILKVHGGTTEKDVVECLSEAKEKALENRKLGIETVVFFDEANTSEVISLVKEIMCDGRCKGIPVPPFLKFVAACNPYRRHSEAMIKNLKGAGLGWHDHTDGKSIIEKLGDIPLRDLVYRVHELPPSMRALVYDFGRLNDKTEHNYIRQIVKDKVQNATEEITEAITKVLCTCQSYMKHRQDECSFVSLRDIERIVIVYKYFLEQFIPDFEGEISDYEKRTHSLVLAISVCYHARLKERSDFERYICGKFRNPLKEINEYDFQDIIKHFQDLLLESMIIPENIAKNTALRENIFMMFVCIELRIPLFVVGKPGSSKSLAKTIIQNSMRGQHSVKEKMRKYQQIHLHSHQCSPLSTPSSIIEIFNLAQRTQDKKELTTKKFVSVVVLDEVGLAEASPYLPLKALHPLLEDGTQGSSSNDHRIEKEKRVAFIGISNWALDPAKMNRGIMVTRGSPTLEDLIHSAKGICSNIDGSREKGKIVLERLEAYFPILANVYSDICKNQKREIYGLRDFYSLIKMLFWMSYQSNTKLTQAQIEHAIRRNFSGFSGTGISPVQMFMDRLKLNELCSLGESGILSMFKDKSLLAFKCNGKHLSCCNGKLIWTDHLCKEGQFIVSVKPGRRCVSLQSLVLNNLWIDVTDENELTLVERSNEKKAPSLEIEDRNGSISLCGYHEFLIPVIPNDHQTNPDNSPVGLIQTSLSTIEKGHGESRYLLFLTENYSAIQTLKNFVINTCLKRQRENAETLDDTGTSDSEPYVLFGSSFPKDSEYTQVCRNISEIRLCMEAGQMVILLNLENLYESLYDVLNQYYIESGGHRYVDLGLRTHRMKCRVHKNFKLILIAESEKVYREFPIPLINRLEKHFVSSNTVLRDFELDVCKALEKWIDSFVNEAETGFKKENAFVGYNQDTAAAVVLQASSDLEYITTAPKGSLNRKNEVLEKCKQLLLQLATPDAIIRAFHSKSLDTNEYNQIQTMYFEYQQHSSLSALIKENPGNLVQVTTHSSSMSQKEIDDFAQFMNISLSDIERCHLESFQTEDEFLQKIVQAIDIGKERKKYFLILECDSGHLYGNLISCCRYRIIDKFSKVNDCSTQIILLIHMPRKYPTSNFVSFQSHPWICIHVDELSENIIDVEKLVVEKRKISELFYSDEYNEYMVSSVSLAPIPPRNLCARMFHCIQEAIGNHKTVLSKCHLRIFEKLIPKSPVFPIQDQNSFYAVLINLIKGVLINEERAKPSAEYWFFSEACNIKNLEESGTFVNALLRKFDRIIIPILSAIFEFVNGNDNLLLAEDENPIISELWLNIFQSQELCQKHLQELALTSTQKPTISKTKQQCQFPFSWLLFNFIKESSPSECYNGDLENILSQISSENVTTELLNRYANDFIYLALTNINDPSHHKILQDTILAMTMKKISEAASSTLFNRIIAIHQIFLEKKKYFVWFSQLISQMPHILRHVCKAAHDEQKLAIKELLFIAVKEAVTNKYANLGDQIDIGSNAVRNWLHKQYETQHVLSSIFKQECQNPEIRALNPKWQWICTTRMFMEEIVLKNEQAMNSFAVKLQAYSLKHNDLQKPDALNTVALVVNLLEDVLQKGKISVTNEEKIVITENCWKFFAMVISNFCMNVENGPPDETLINRLIDMIFPNSLVKSKDMFYRLMQNHPEHLPDMRSLFFKLLLQHIDDFSFVERHLKTVFSRMDEIVLKDYCLLVIEYLKDNFELTDDKSWTNLVTNYFRIFFDEFDGSSSSAPVSLLRVSKLQFSLICLANWMNDQSPECSEDADVQFFLSEAKTELRKEMKKNASCGPVWFFTEVMVRKFGFAKYLKTSETHFKWIVADEKLTKDPYHFFDVAALYNPIYEDIRSDLADAIASNMNELALKSESLRSNDVVPLVLALYQRVRLSHVSDLPLKQIKTEVLHEMLKFVRNCKLLSDEKIQEVVVSLIENKQCIDFSFMQAKMLETEEDYIYDLVRTLVIHSVLAVLTNRRDNLIKVLYLLLTSPESLKESFIPGMPLTIPRTYNCGGEFPSCVKAHKHPSVLVDQLCLYCGNRIIHKPNKPGVLKEIPCIVASPGYLQDEGNVTPLVGYNCAVSCSITRVIIHSCLLWASCNGKNVQEVFSLAHLPQINYASFFWQKINHDLYCLSKALGRSIPETSIIIHLVLKEITQKDHGVIENVKSMEKLTSDQERQKWELQFEKEYITPVLQDIDGCLRGRMQRLTLKDHNMLFSAAYMHSDEESHYWHFHPQISVDHFKFHTISLKLRTCNPVLYMFLTEQENIEATLCIPSIVQLQQLIQQNICQKFGQKEQLVVEEMTFRNFVDASQDQKMEDLLEPLQSAWNVAKHKLFRYDRLEVNSEHIVDEITEHTKMKHLIPTTNGPGVITTALVDFLVNIHNAFIVTSRKFLEESLQREWLWQIRTVSIQKIDQMHLVNCRDKLLPLIHSHYIRKINSGSCEIVYDIKGMEKDLILDFVMGKPIITNVYDIPVPLWQDLTTVLSMKAIERNIPQESLSQQAKSEILSELKDVSMITSVREVLETVMKFLLSKNHKKETKLKDFMERHLGMFGRLKSQKVAEYCSLANVVSLWKLLSVERMKFCVRNSEEPFLEYKSVHEQLSQLLSPKDNDSLENALSKMTRVEILLDVVFQFILAQNSMKCLEKTLKLSLMSELERFIEQTDSESIPQFSELFPGCLQVCQAVEVWKKIVLHQDDIKKQK